MSRAEQRTEPQDPLIDEVRAIRKAISDRCDDDFDKLGEYLRKVGDEYRQRMKLAETRTGEVDHET